MIGRDRRSPVRRVGSAPDSRGISDFQPPSAEVLACLSTVQGSVRSGLAREGFLNCARLLDAFQLMRGGFQPSSQQTPFSNATALPHLFLNGDSHVSCSFLRACCLTSDTGPRPGLDTALVLRSSISRSRSFAFATALGISTGAMIWGVAVGVSALLAASE